MATISLYTGACLCFRFNFAVNQPENNENEILREIINNFLRKYFTDDPIFVSLIIFSSKGEQNRDFIHSLFNNNKAWTEFSHTILDKVDNTTRGNRNPLNLIVVDDITQLR